MVKLSILFRQPESHDEFETFYNANLALMERIPGVTRRQVNMVFGAPGGPSPYYRVLELYFEDYEALDSAMRTPEGEAAGRHLMMHAAELADMFFSEVYEEEGGSTP
jgi:uncharacterized protein (TIGR02118 family)